MLKTTIKYIEEKNRSSKIEVGEKVHATIDSYACKNTQGWRKK